MYRLIENGDGTLTMEISEGVRDMRRVEPEDVFDRVTVIRFPASMEDLGGCPSYIFRNLSELRVHPESRHFTVEDGIVFSKDKKKIIRYPKSKEGDTYYVDDCVEVIGTDCFSVVDHLKHIYIGRGVRRIENCALVRDMCFCLSKIYIPPTVTELEGEIFDEGGDDGGTYYPISIVGGERGSVIETYCNKRNIPFVAVEEDGIEAFYAQSCDELRALAREQAECEREFFVDEAELGYQAKFADGTLEFFVPDAVTMPEIAVKDTRAGISRYRREKVEKLIIGDRITELADLAFDDYENLKSVYIGADVKWISPAAFSGKDESGSNGCPNLERIAVSENNRWFTAEDGVLYTADRQTLVKYCPARQAAFHRVDARVRRIAPLAFEYAKELECLEIGDGVLSVGKLAFVNVQALRHVYVGANASEWPERFPFVELYAYDPPYRIEGLIVGGSRGSFIEAYCRDNGECFHVIEEGEREEFLRIPLPALEDDAYWADCQRQMRVDGNGNLLRVGEVGDELILPDGVVRVQCRIDLTRIRRIVLPSTFAALWPAGFDGSADQFEGFAVSEGNPNYRAIDGHLYRADGTLCVYVPAAGEYGILPEQTTGIGKLAFYLLSHPFDTLVIPASVCRIEEPHRHGGLFREAVVAADNRHFKSVDGSIYTADGKTLIRAKMSSDELTVADGTETIERWALSDVEGTVTIPASVCMIRRPFCGSGENIVFRVPRGSEADQVLRETVYYGTVLELTENGEVVERWKRPGPEESDE